MEPCRAPEATLEDLLERVLDKGIVVKLDLVIGVAGIPLIGISLQAAIAAIETMLEYGLMNDWDAAAGAAGETRERQFEPQPGERTVLELYGSYHHARGIFRVWRPGRLIVTDRRLLLIRPADAEVLFETPVTAIAGLGRLTVDSAGEGKREVICLALADGELAMLYVPQPDLLEAALRAKLRRLGQQVVEISRADIELLGPATLAQGQLWHQCTPGRGPLRWKSGWAMLTPTELAWRPDTAQRGSLCLPLTQICRLAVEQREVGTLGERDVLVVTHGAGGDLTQSMFAGDGISSWSAAIGRAAATTAGHGNA